MIRNYFLVMIRNLRKNRIYSFINIAGLSIGITCSILILLWVFDELSYNRFLPKADRLYQLKANVTYDGSIHTWGAVPLAAYEAIRPETSHIANSAAVDWGGDHLLSVGDKKINKRGHFVTGEFLSMFEFPAVKGNDAHPLDAPGTIVITKSTAQALFGDEDPINQIIRVDNRYDQKVTGVISDVPHNSSLKFDVLLPWALRESIDPWVKSNRNKWDSYSYAVYVELDNDASRAAAEDAIRDLPARFADPSEKAKGNIKHELFLHALTDWKLYGRFENGNMAGGDIEYVRLFSTIAIFVLVMACINFMNLATARSERRAKEVGIRKSIGSARRELIFQFISESVFIAMLSFGISLLLAELLMPSYNDLVQKQLHIPYTTPSFWLFAGVIILFTGIISGSYPALYLSSFRPVQVLKGKVQIGKGASLPRKILVTLQFGFSIVLIIGMIIIYQQVQFVKNRDMGFDRENLITVKSTDDIAKQYKVIKQELLQTGIVQSVTQSNNEITGINNWSFLGWPGKPEDQRVIFANVSTDYDYTKTMGIRMYEGRDFSEEFPSDSAALLINKAALDLMGLKNPIGQELTFYNGKKRKLIGVMENAVMTSPYESVYPMFMEFQPDWIEAVTIRLEKTTDLSASIKKVESIFHKFSPEYPFEYTFVDVEFQKKFADINLIARLANLFATLAIVITGLGLFGLASYTAAQRTREIGIRKVLGASVTSLVTLMSGDFSKLVAAAFIVSAPLAWWALSAFLERYAYRVTIAWWVFPLTGAGALLFALLTVSLQAYRAARANPVNTLRSE